MSISDKFPLAAQSLGLVTYMLLAWYLHLILGPVEFYAYLVMFILIGIVWFAFAMKLQAYDKKHPIRWPLRGLVYAFVAVGYVYDVIVLNWLVGTTLFVEYAKEFPLTARLQRILREHRRDTALNRYRLRMAQMLCDKILHRYDPEHCL